MERRRERISWLRWVTLAVFVVYFGAWVIGQLGDDKNWIVALAGTGVCGNLIAFTLIAGVLFALRRRWVDLTATAGLLLIYLVVSGQLLIPLRRPQRPQGDHFRALTFNVEHGWEGIERVAEVIRSQNADVFTLQELGTGGELGAIHDLQVLLPEYHFTSDSGRTSGSKLPIVRERIIPLNDLPNSWSMVEQVVKFKGQELRVLNVHSPSYLPSATLKRPVVEWFSRWGELSIEQEAHLKREIAAIQSDSIPTILCGDFNMTPTCSRYRMLAAKGHDAFITAGVGTGWTMPSRMPFRRIDYIWAFHGIQPVSCFVVDHHASDHAAVVADLVLPKSESAR